MNSYLSTKFGVNLVNGFQENAFYGWSADGQTTDGRTAMDEPTTTLSLLTQSNRAKNSY